MLPQILKERAYPQLCWEKGSLKRESLSPTPLDWLVIQMSAQMWGKRSPSWGPVSKEAPVTVIIPYLPCSSSTWQHMTFLFVKVFVALSQNSELFKGWIWFTYHCPALEQYLYFVVLKYLGQKKKKKDPKTEIYFNPFILKRKSPKSNFRINNILVFKQRRKILKLCFVWKNAFLTSR